MSLCTSPDGVRRDMSYLFKRAQLFNSPIGSWNVSTVKSMRDYALHRKSQMPNFDYSETVRLVKVKRIIQFLTTIGRSSSLQVSKHQKCGFAFITSGVPKIDSARNRL